MFVEMPSNPSITFDRSVFESIDSQVQTKTLSKEKAYDQLTSYIKGSALDLPSIAKLWETNDSKDPPSIYEKIKLVLVKLVEVLQTHKTAVRIGHVFKDQFMTIWTQVLKEFESYNITIDDHRWIAENVTKPILGVRDIRWLLKDLEGYIIRSNLFQFKKFDIIPKSESMSRDNFYIVKKYFEDEEERKFGKYNKWTICNKCQYDSVEDIQNAIENEAPFNIRDQPSNQTDELWVALKYGRLKVINFLLEYEEKEGRPIVFTEEHAKYLRKLGHLELLRTLMPQFLTKEEKDGASPSQPVPTLPEISHDQFYEKISSGTQLQKINRELLFVDKPVDKKYFKYKNTADSVILFYNKDTNLAKIEPELVELQKRVPKVSFGKTTFDPPYYKRKYSNCNGPITTYHVAFFRNGCSLYNNSDNESSDFLYQQIQMAFYQITIIPENEEFAKLRKKFENVKGDTTMSMADVKEYVRYTSIKSNPRELYENLTTSIHPNDNTNADDYRTPFKYTLVTEEEMKMSEMSREDSDYERKQRAQEAAKSLRDPMKPSIFDYINKNININKNMETEDASNPESFMYSRTIFSHLKARYGEAVDFTSIGNKINKLPPAETKPIEEIDLQEVIKEFYKGQKDYTDNPEKKSVNVSLSDTPIEEILSETN